MATAYVRAETLYAWQGSSLLVVAPDGSCGPEQPLTGFYHREARALRTLQIRFNGKRLWLCEAAQIDPDRLDFAYVYPELIAFGGGGTGQSGDEESRDADGLTHRSLSVSVSYRVTPTALNVQLTIVNHARHEAVFDAAIDIDADFVDIQDAIPPQLPTPRAHIESRADGTTLTFTHRDEALPYISTIDAAGQGWTWHGRTLKRPVRLEPHGRTALELHVHATAVGARDTEDEAERRQVFDVWRQHFTRVVVPGNRVAEAIVAANVRDFASFALLEGPRDEWLTLQAGMPLYPALFGRDTLTAGWQAAFLDRGQSLEASLTTLGRMQSDRVYDWRDEEPGRIPYQVRRGPQAILNLNPYSAYYADFASPLMFVIALAHLYSWTGEKETIARHWDTARRVLDWASTYGDKDRDGYLEYETKSRKGTKNQGWKDSGDAIVYDDGTPVPPPIATCEIQGYWYAAQRVMSVFSTVMGSTTDARAYWQSAADLKERFNRDWWVAAEGCVALARDREKRLVPAVTSNAGHCVASGIVNGAHLPACVGRLFAPDMFSGWGIRTLSSAHVSYNPQSYHCGSVWAVEQATIAFGLRRFGFDARALDLTDALFTLAQLYPEYRIPETIGGFSRAERPTPSAYPQSNTPQLWNASAFPLLVHTMLGLQPVAAVNLLVVDPVLPHWMPEVTLERLRIGDALATLRFHRDTSGRSHAEIVHKQGPLRLVHQPPIESLTAGIRDRMSALFESVTGISV